MQTASDVFISLTAIDCISNELGKIMNGQIISFVESIRSNPKIISLDQNATKQSIILTVLFVLGWNIFNTNEVSPGCTVKPAPIDFSLKIHSLAKVFLKVGKPKQDLHQYRRQLLNYSLKKGVELAVLSNGIRWGFYLPQAQGRWGSRRFCLIDLYQQDPQDATVKFIDFLSQEKVNSGNSLQKAKLVYYRRFGKQDCTRCFAKSMWKNCSDPDRCELNKKRPGNRFSRA